MTQARHCRLCFEACSVYYTLLDPKGNCNKKSQILQNYFEEKFLNAERRRNLTVVCLNCWQPVCDFNKFKESLLLLDATFDETQKKAIKNEAKLPDDIKFHIKKEPDENHPPNDQQKPQLVDENSNNKYSKETLTAGTSSAPANGEDSSLSDESLEDFEISLSDVKKEPNENQNVKDLKNSKAMESKPTAKSKESNFANNNSMQSLDFDESLEDFEFSFCNDAPVKVEKIDNDDKKNVVFQMISIPAEKENLKQLEDSLEDFNISLCDVKNEANENQPPNLHLDTPQTNEATSVIKNSPDRKSPSDPQTLSQNPNEMNQSVDDFDISFTELESIDIQFSSDDDASLPDSVDTARSESQMKYDDNISERLKVRHNWDKCHLEALRQRLEEADDDDKPSLRIELEKVMDAVRERRRRLRKNNRRNRRLKRLQEKKRRRHYD